METTVEFIKTKLIPNIQIIHYFSDGCAGQYKNFVKKKVLKIFLNIESKHFLRIFQDQNFGFVTKCVLHWVWITFRHFCNSNIKKLGKNWLFTNKNRKLSGILKISAWKQFSIMILKYQFCKPRWWYLNVVQKLFSTPIVHYFSIDPLPLERFHCSAHFTLTLSTCWYLLCISSHLQK